MLKDSKSSMLLSEDQMADMLGLSHVGLKKIRKKELVPFYLVGSRAKYIYREVLDACRKGLKV